MYNGNNDLSALEEANILIARARYSQVTLDALARVPLRKFGEVSLGAKVPYTHLLRLSLGSYNSIVGNSLPKLYNFFFPDMHRWEAEQTIERGWRYGCKL